MIVPGYYDISFPVECEQYSADPDALLEPERTYTETETWLGARVLMVDGHDLIIEHYPVGWRNVVRRIDRVNPGWAKSMTFKAIKAEVGA